MREVTAYVAVGSNIDEYVHVPAALKKMMRQLQIVNLSTHFITPPLDDRENQRAYLNGVWRLSTSMPVASLVRLLKNIEKQEGRKRFVDRFASRTLDLDLILYDNLVDERLGLPDKDTLGRDFVFKPLLELDYHLIWPLTGRLLRDEVSLNETGSLEPNLEITRILKNILQGNSDG